jgi:hypothetical protein
MNPSWRLLLGLLALWWPHSPASAQDAGYAQLVDKLCVKTIFQPDEINRQALAIGGHETTGAAGMRTWHITSLGASTMNYIVNTVPQLGFIAYVCNVNFPQGNYEYAIESLKRYFNPREGQAVPTGGGTRVYKFSGNIFPSSFDQAASLTVNSFPAGNVIISANFILKTKS